MSARSPCWAGCLAAQAARDAIHTHANVALLVQPGHLAVEVIRRDREIVAKRIAALDRRCEYSGTSKSAVASRMRWGSTGASAGAGWEKCRDWCRRAAIHWRQLNWCAGQRWLGRWRRGAARPGQAPPPAQPGPAWLPRLPAAARPRRLVARAGLRQRHHCRLRRRHAHVRRWQRRCVALRHCPAWPARAPPMQTAAQRRAAAAPARTAAAMSVERPCADNTRPCDDNGHWLLSSRRKRRHDYIRKGVRFQSRDG